MRQPYEVREVIARLLDDSDFQEFKPEFGSSLVCGTGYWRGLHVGILAINGVLFSDSSVKGRISSSCATSARFPLAFPQNITGFMVGTQAERGGIARHSAKLVYAMATARVPRYTVIMGGSYGAGNYGMCGRGFGPRFLFAWPNSRIATMSADIAVNVLTELRRASLRGGSSDGELADIEARTRAQFTEQSDPYYATARLWDDGLILPVQTCAPSGCAWHWGVRNRPRARPRPFFACRARVHDRCADLRDGLARPRSGVHCQSRRDRLPHHPQLPASGFGEHRGLFRRGCDARVLSREADRAVRIGPADAAHSYLDVEAVVQAAVAAGARSLHPAGWFFGRSARCWHAAASRPASPGSVRDRN